MTMKSVRTNKPFSVAVRHSVFKLDERRKAREAIARIKRNEFATEEKARSLISTLPADVQPLLDVSKLVGFA